MKRCDADFSICRDIAEEFSVECSDVRNAITSYFGNILSDARKLPFKNGRKIFLHDKFEELSTIYNIPFIGRIGPSYSRYLKWRSNSINPSMTNRRTGHTRKLSDEDIENLAEAILEDAPLPDINKESKQNKNNKVWLVGSKGKKLARQIIINDKEYVQDK